MASTVVILASLAMMLVILASILGAVDRPERRWFVGGIGLFIIAHVGGWQPELVGTVLALVGLVVAAASTVPLLRQPV